MYKPRINENLARRLKVFKLTREVQKIRSDTSVVFCYVVKGGWYYRPDCRGYTAHQYEAGVFKKEDACEWVFRTHGDLTAIPVDVAKHNNVIVEKIKELLNCTISTEGGYKL